MVRAEASARLRLQRVVLPPRPFTLLDVFTDEPLTGNGLAVVHDADALSDETMLAFARETKLSETSFVQTADAEGADYRHRIFMTTGEIPFAGHPSLGTAAAVAHARGESRVTYVQQTQPGLQPIDVELDGQHGRVSMLQEPPVYGVEEDPEEVLRAVGLGAEVMDPRLPVQVVSTGVNQVLACVGDPAFLAELEPDYDVIGPLLARHAAITLYVAHVDVEAGRARARSFTATAQQGEDPATGSAVGPLCAHVAARTGQERLEIVQGVEMGRRSVLRCAIEGDRVRVGGDVVVLIDGTVHLDT